MQYQTLECSEVNRDGRIITVLVVKTDLVGKDGTVIDEKNFAALSEKIVIILNEHDHLDRAVFVPKGT